MIGDKSHVAYGFEETSGAYRLVLDGSTCIFTKEYDPTRICSEMAGKLARLLVDDGAEVKAGDAIVELEVMKMYLSLKSPEDGKIHFERSEGSKLEPGDLIARLDLADPTKVKKSERYSGVIPDSLSSKSSIKTKKPHLCLRDSLQTLHSVMKGFAVSMKSIEDSVKMLSISAQDPMLPVVELEEALSTLSGRLPGPLSNAMRKLCDEFRAAVTNSQSQIDAMAEKDRLDAIPVLFQLHTSDLPAREVATMRTNASVLLELPQRFGSKSAPRLVQEIVRLLSEYVRVERLSGDKKMRIDERFKMLRETPSISTKDLYSIGLAHLSSSRRMRLVEMLLKRLAPEGGEKLSDQSESVASPVRRERNFLKCTRFTHQQLEHQQHTGTQRDRVSHGTYHALLDSETDFAETETSFLR